MTGAKTLEITIDELSPGGDGVGICDIDGERRAVFVGGALRGERVAAEVDTRERPARGRLLRVLTPSPARVAPPCAHVERCGGCDWMFLAVPEQAVEHARIAAHALRLAAPPVVHPHPSADALGYRTRARVHVVAKRGPIAVGMFARRSHEPASVDTCVVLDPILDRVRAELPIWLAGARGRGEAQLSLGSPDERPRRAVLDLRWRGELPGAIFGRFEQATIGPSTILAGARIYAGDVRVPATIGDPTPFIVAADGLPLRLAAGGFSQATESGNEVLARRVTELVRGLPAGPVVELYAGAGNLTVLVARDRTNVVAVERSREACEAARRNLADRKLEQRARVVEADAADFAIPRGCAVVILDPPREGARAVAEALAATKSRVRPAVVYVACDLATLARDVRILVDSGYVVSTVETFELFPHTSHVETVVVLARPPA